MGSEDEDESDYSEPDLSWLPDPDKVYGKEGGNNESGSEGDSSDSDEAPEETIEVKEGKRKLTVIKSVIPNKRSRHGSSSSSSNGDSEDEVLDTGLSLGDDEDLAL